MNGSLEIKYVEVQLIKPYDKNSRIHIDKHIDEIVSSINTFKFTNPILIDENNIILAGHGRWLAAKKLNIDIDKVPCIQIDYLNEAQKKAYRIADNKLTLNDTCYYNFSATPVFYIFFLIFLDFSLCFSYHFICFQYLLLNWFLIKRGNKYD